MAKAISPIVIALNAESYDWLSAQNPDLVSAIEAEVAAGTKAETIYRMVSQYVGPERQALAVRVRQATHHILLTQRG